MRLKLIMLLIWCSGEILAQDFTQTIRGNIQDLDNRESLIGANVTLLNTEYGAITDEYGNYRLEEIPVGRYQLKISYIGYKTLILPEILVETGKEVIKDILLTSSSNELTEVVVRSERSQVLHPVSTRTITVEETRRFPATFFDPARLATVYAGVVNTNDQANGLIIRGNAPNGLQWQLEGAEIVNPNHTSNAGTASDRPTLNSGGVNILSAQMLDNSTFLTGAFPAQYGNAVSGILDMNFRKGNNEAHEFTGQIGLIGLDIAAEGPLSKKQNASYLANYRYSTIGLLGKLGVPLGDEAITFQDLAFNLSFPFNNGGKLNLFGMGGVSENIFTAERDPSLWEEQKDRFDIRFDSKMGAMGATYLLPVGAKSIWSSTLVYSGTESLREASRLDDNLELKLEEEDYLQLSKLSFFTQVNTKLNSRNQLKVGISTVQNNHQLNGVFLDNSYEEKLDYLLLRPFVNWTTQISSKLTWNIGLSYTYSELGIDEKKLWEPRSSLALQIDEQQSISVAYGHHNYVQPFQSFAIFNPENDVLFDHPGADPLLNRAKHLVIAYEIDFKADMVFNVEAYYQDLSNLKAPLQDMPQSFSGDYEGKNIGIEVSLQKYFVKDFYFLVNGTIYDSKFSYKEIDNTSLTFPTRYAGRYGGNLLIGKEWKKTKDKLISIAGVNLRVVYQGGLRATAIDEAATIGQERAQPIYVNDPFGERLANYFRTDLRLYLKRNKTKYSNTLALDIQNVSNHQNIAFRYYDNFQDAIVTKYQLGLIPILSYWIEF